MIKNVVRYQNPKKWGVLCIDTWDLDSTNDNFYQQAVEQLRNFNIVCVVNCTMNIKIDYNDPSVFNTFKNYQWHPLTGHTDLNQKIMLNLLQASGHLPTSKILKNHLFGDHTVHLSDTTTFIQHVNLFYPGIQDWIVLGSAWKICLHHGPLGFDKLLNIPSMAFHIFPQWSVQKEDGSETMVDDLENDIFVWAEVPNNGFRLVTMVDGIKWKRD